ncbi:MAG: heme-binding domain-containing protein [Chitinophagaceae bacterium]|nr:heme-binding domain-containing protein [Chitinophagaceae bacterium]
MQFVPVQRNKSSGMSSSDFMNVYQVPDAIQNKLRVACYDCHSNNTRYSWYNNIQPVAWLLERHVSLGKAELDFSVWKDYSVRRKRTKLKSIISQIDEGAMPLSTYTLLHRDAVFSKEEKELVLEWLQQLRDSL